MAGERNFSEEQLKGLKGIGYTFVVDVRPIDIYALEHEHSADYKRRQWFTGIYYVPGGRLVVPQVRQVAVNPEMIALPGSEDLTSEEQQTLVRRTVRSYKAKRLRHGMLRGVSFGLDYVSTMAQIDTEFRLQNNGRFLLRDFFRTLDQDEQGDKAIIGHPGQGESPLNVMIWPNSRRFAYLYVALVATPEGER